MAAPSNTHAPVPVLQLSEVQGLLSVQTVPAPETQAPLLHTSPTVQALPSVHTLPLLVCVHPVVALQASLVQALPSSQLSAGPGLQMPAVQASVVVHTLLSALQGRPELMLT